MYTPLFKIFVLFLNLEKKCMLLFIRNKIVLYIHLIWLDYAKQAVILLINIILSTHLALVASAEKPSFCIFMQDYKIMHNKTRDFY